MLDIRYYKYPKTPLEREINKERKEAVKKIVANIELKGIDELYEKGYQTEKDFLNTVMNLLKEKLNTLRCVHSDQ